MDPSVNELLNRVASYSSKWNVLIENLPMLLEKIELIEVLPRLKSRGILRDPQLQVIDAENVPFCKIAKLIDSLQKCDEKYFLPFCEILCETGQVHLIEIMNRNNIGTSLSVNSQSVHAVQRGVQSTMDNDLKQAAYALKAFYKRKLRYVHPFSLPFKFDIETTWISLALQKKNNDQNTFIRMEDHHQLITEAFETETKLLYIEGRAASGKTSLMRRIAYDWALGKLAQYDLVLLIELRNLCANTFDSIYDLILSDIESSWECEANDLQSLLSCIQTIKKNSRYSWLILLDGHDELKSRSTVCKELQSYLESSKINKTLKFDIIISSRPGYLSTYKEHSALLNFAEILGFDTAELQSAYIAAHFSRNVDASKQIAAAEELLESSASFRKLATTPLFLTFICLMHQYLKLGSVFELYTCIIWWLIDRYQRDHEDENVPQLFGYFDQDDNQETFRIIQNQFLNFPLLQKIGKMALELSSPADYFFTPNSTALQSHDIDSAAINTGIILIDKHRENATLIERYLFPHRTIQEFLAGGLFYFWPTICASKRPKCCVCACANGNLGADLIMCLKRYRQVNNTGPRSEIEHFIWRSIVIENLEIRMNPVIEQFFSFYSDLSLDLAIMDQCNKSEHFVKVLNACLRKCTKVYSLNLFYANSLRSRERILDFSSMKHLTCLTIDLNSFFIHENLFVLHDRCSLRTLSLRSLTISWTIFWKTMERLANNEDLKITFRNVKIKMASISSVPDSESRLTVVVDCTDAVYISEFMLYCPQMNLQNDLVFSQKSQQSSMSMPSAIESHLANKIGIHFTSLCEARILKTMLQLHVAKYAENKENYKLYNRYIAFTAFGFNDPDGNEPADASGICKTCLTSMMDKGAVFIHGFPWTTVFSKNLKFIIKTETNMPFCQSMSVGDIDFGRISLPVALDIGYVTLDLHKL